MTCFRLSDRSIQQIVQRERYFGDDCNVWSNRVLLLASACICRTRASECSAALPSTRISKVCILCFCYMQAAVCKSRQLGSELQVLPPIDEATGKGTRKSVPLSPWRGHFAGSLTAWSFVLPKINHHTLHLNPRVFFPSSECFLITGSFFGLEEERFDKISSDHLLTRRRTFPLTFIVFFVIQLSLSHPPGAMVN